MDDVNIKIGWRWWRVDQIKLD